MGLRLKWQSSEVDSARRGPPGKKVVGESSMQPVGGAGGVLRSSSPTPLERYCESSELAQSTPRSRCLERACSGCTEAVGSNTSHMSTEHSHSRGPAGQPAPEERDLSLVFSAAREKKNNFFGDPFSITLDTSELLGCLLKLKIISKGIFSASKPVMLRSNSKTCSR